MIPGRQCLCCKNCSDCKEFKKVVSETGFQIYLYNKNVENVNSDCDISKHHGFVLKNTQDITINSNDLLRKIESNEFSCQRCKTILKRVSNVIKGTFIKKNEIIVICDCCISERISCGLQPCSYCHKIYEKFISNRKLQDNVTKAYAEKWVSKIRHLLRSKRDTEKLLDFEKNENKIVVHSSQPSSPGHVAVKDTRSLLVGLKTEIREVNKKVTYLSNSAISLDTDIKLEPNSINDILKNVSEETFKYVFPKIDIENSNLRERISSSELVREIQQKVNLSKASDKEKFEEGKKKKIKKDKYASLRVILDEQKNDILKDQSNVGTDGTIRKHRKMLHGTEIATKITEDKIEDSHITKKNVIEDGKKRKELRDIKVSGIEIKEKRGRDKTKDSGTTERKKEERNMVDKNFAKSKHIDTNSLGIEIKKTKRSDRVKEVEESGDFFPSVKIASKEIFRKKVRQEKDESGSKRRKLAHESGKISVSDSFTRAIKEAKNKPKTPKQSRLAIKQSEHEKSGKSLPTESLNLSRVKIRNASIDDLHIEMVKVKQSSTPQEKAKQPLKLPELSLPTNIQGQIYKSNKTQVEVSGTDSERDIEFDQLLLKNKLKKINEAIIGQKIIKHKAPSVNIMALKEVKPILFESTFKEINTELNREFSKEDTKDGGGFMPSFAERRPQSPFKSINKSDQDPSKGAVRYALSNRSFIDKGWTMLPTEKIVRKLNVYRMRPSHPEFDWFEHNKSRKQIHYDTGGTLAEFNDDGRGRWFYRNGRLALDYYNAEEMNAGQRYVVYSNGEPDKKGRSRPITVLATFDYLGNGIVFDHTGKIRLKYNQTEGVVLDREIGPVSHWKWHELNDPPVLQKVMIDTQMAVKDPEILKIGGTGRLTARLDNEEMLAIEFDNFIKEKSKKLSQKFKPFQIKMKALKINENFSLRVLDQATVHLLFRDGSTNLKLNLGMILDHKEIVDTDTAEVGEVSCSLERFPARTDSLAMLQRSVAHAQHVDRLRIERERRFKLSEESTSVDRLFTGVSRPLQPPVHTLLDIECCCKFGKPATCTSTSMKRQY